MAEVSAKHMRMVSTGPKLNAQNPVPVDCTFGSGIRVAQNLGERPLDGAAAVPLPDAGGRLLILTARQAPRSSPLPGVTPEVAVTGQCEGLNRRHVSDPKAFSWQDTRPNKP